MKNLIKYGRCHIHSENSTFDSKSSVKQIVDKAVSMGSKNLCLTDHGILTGIDDFLELGKTTGLNTIPGVEAYIQNEGDLHYSHLIIFAKNNDGYKAITLAVTESNKNLDGTIPKMNREIIEKYFGKDSIGYNNVYVTSACMNGPLMVILRSNEYLLKEITKMKVKKQSLISPDNKSFLKLQKEVNSLTKEITELTKEIKEIEKISKRKFGKTERSLKKLDESSDEYKAMNTELNNLKNETQKARETLPIVVEELIKLKVNFSEKNHNLKEYNVLVDNWKFFDNNIKILEAKIDSDEDLYQKALLEAKWYNETIGYGNFYIELQNHRIEQEIKYMPIVAKIAKELNVPVIAANDEHMIEPSDFEGREIMKFLRFNEYKEPFEQDKELYFKSDDELSSILKEILSDDIVEEAMENLSILNNCHVTMLEEQHYPKYADNANELIKQFCEDRISWRYPNTKDFTEEHRKRLNYELDVITSMGYSDYFLIVQDFLDYGRSLGNVPDEEIQNSPLDLEECKKWVKDNGWDVGVGIGPGRGSAVGSIVSYLLGITDVDPIKYDLIFERFLSKERVSMPDIDSDFKTNIRDRVIDYVKAKYGKDAVCCIITKNTQAPKGAIRNCARYYGAKKYGDNDFLLSKANMLAKLVPGEPGMTFEKCDKQNIFSGIIDEDEKRILELARSVEGSVVSYGMHAAGVIIADNGDVKQYTPLRYNTKKSQWTTQCNKEQSEHKGLLKMDFLGLRNLDVITECLQLVEKRKGKKIALKDIPFVKEVFKTIFSKGLTNNVFQFESAGMKNMLQRFCPDTIEDIILLVAVFRPGPIQYLDSIIEVKQGKKTPEYVLPEMKDILGKTYGYPVYQEQIMQIYNKFAGYSLGKSDDVRKCMSKKNTEKLVKEHKEPLINGLVSRGATIESATKFFNELVEFGKYAFNKSHAAAYAFVAYYTAYFKKFYPHEYLTAVMNHILQKKLIGVINDARTFGVQVKTPNVNFPTERFALRNDDILFGLNGIKNVGNVAKDIAKISKEKPFVSFKDFMLRGHIKKDVTEALIYAGTLDEFLPTRMSGITILPVYLEKIDVIKKKKNFIMKANNLIEVLSTKKFLSFDDLKEYTTTNNISIPSDVKKIVTIESLKKRINNATIVIENMETEINSIPLLTVEENNGEMMKKEKEFLGSYVSAHPLDSYNLEDDFTTIEHITEGQATVIGVVSDYKDLERKIDGAKMCSFTIEDKTNNLDAIVFTKGFAQFGHLIKEDEVLIFTGKVVVEISEQNDDDNEPIVKKTLQVQNVETISPNKDNYIITNMNIAKFESEEVQTELKHFVRNQGSKLFIINKLDGLVRETIYKVDNSILSSKFFKIIKG